VIRESRARDCDIEVLQNQMSLLDAGGERGLAAEWKALGGASLQVLRRRWGASFSLSSSSSSLSTEREYLLGEESGKPSKEAARDYLKTLVCCFKVDIFPHTQIPTDLSTPLYDSSYPLKRSHLHTHFYEQGWFLSACNPFAMALDPLRQHSAL